MCSKKTDQNMPFFRFTAATFLVFLGLGDLANPNMWTGAEKRTLWHDWSVSLNGGYTSYFGDLSIYDSDPANKLRHESKPAFGVMASKFFTDELAVSGQMVYGGLKGTYNENLSFDTDFLEYNVQLRVDLLNLIFRRNNTGLGLVAFGGVGHMLFNSVKYAREEGRVNNYPHRASAPEFVYFAGGGIQYRLSDRFSANLDVAIRQVQNDRIDNEVRKDNFDFYSFINVGVSYHIKHLFGRSKKGNLYGRGVRMAKK